jgi:(S)-2-hydroxyglutarate dehydrogenase
MTQRGRTTGGTTDVLVIGAGLVGLATARAIQLAHPDSSVVVLEKETAIARHQSGRNSGVIHAGLYYAPGSLKAELCREGRERLIAYAEERGIEYRLTGKLVVAVDESELPRFDELRRRGEANGLQGLRELGPGEWAEFEPHVTGIRALHVPETGVIDYRAVAQAYAEDVRRLGGSIELGVEVAGIARRPDHVVVRTRAGRTFVAGRLVTCAGLQSDRIAALTGNGSRERRIAPFRGDYFVLAGEARSFVRGHVYPVPDPAFPFLGVHFTRRLDGEVWAGPNAVPSLAREQYRRLSFQPRDAVEMIGFRGLWRLGRRHARTGLAEIARDVFPRAALKEMRRYIPALERRHIRLGPSGIRAQVLSRDGALVDDFILERDDNVLHVVNAPSPAATASLAIADRLAAQVTQTSGATGTVSAP